MKQQAYTPGPHGIGGPAYGLFSFFFFGLLLLFLTSGEEHCAILPYTHALDYSF